MVRNRLPRLATSVLAIFFGLGLFAPLPYVVLTPGKAQDVLQEVITPKDKSESSPIFYPVDGKIFLLTILITNPSAYVTGVELIYSWLRSDYAVMPRALFYKPGRSAQAEVKIAKAEMVDSQLSSKVAALNYLRANSPATDFSSVKQENIKIALSKTGGPSAGLAFALGIVELLTPTNILAGRSVAVTGTIDEEGNVGGIGGIAEKILAADKAGATFFIVPIENCSDLAPAIARIPSGIKIAAVATLKEAIGALNSNHPRGCANLGA